MARLAQILGDLKSRFRALPGWARALSYVVGGGVLFGVLVVFVAWLVFARGLPDAAQLAEYEPPLPSHVRAADGTPFTSFARERRIFLDYEQTPKQLVGAFVSAEDKTFFTHPGFDLPGIFQAAITNLKAMGTGKRPVGASTITQQVAKNLLLTNEVSYVRKVKEIFLARRIEQALTKPDIIELYLNQIFLGRSAYGVQAASFAYFNKPVDELTLAQTAFLAVLPKAPANYNPSNEKGRARAFARRNWVLGQMAENGYVTAAEARAAAAEPIVVVNRAEIPRDRTGEYFMEDIRRELVEKYGEEGEHGIYTGGLWIRSTIDPEMQRAAEMALRDGLVKYDRPRGWRGATDKIELGEGWPQRLRAVNLPVGYDDWRAAVVLEKAGGVISLGFEDGTNGRMSAQNASLPVRGVGVPAFQRLAPGDVIPVKRISGSDYTLRQIPDIGGGMVVMEVSTGRVLAMVGGFDARRSQYNRATQAMRQPGSAIKPFVYAAALENGYTPASVVVDAPYCVFQTRSLGTKCFRNFSGGYAGPQTMRWGLEQSRNLMTVRLAYNTGMDKVVETIDQMGIAKLAPVLSMSLGAGETTVMKLTNAYAMLANGGKRQSPVLYDLIQDRHGRTIYRADARDCAGCNTPDWDGDAMPRPADARPQAIDGKTAYQVVHMLEGVVQRGTAVVLRDLNRPMFGKTGTTNGPTNVWFVGGTPDVVAGLYIGFDEPKNMGGYAQGGTLAAPVFKQFAIAALKDMPKRPFEIAPGVRMVRIDRRSGKRVYGGWQVDTDPRAAVIWEAFKPESEPRRLAAAYDPFEKREVVRSDSDFLQSTGGIY
ncbi:penicillin-binding protein 1A [Sphingosinicella microcystinivorans]|uniref:Penicillin-binding protein 1A n=1 Tax=Sphingosinicella microcystinivorans TaxID=335406 RepID=A0AAD1D708_SPHMI|nr:PBP1A family penicillin-binding protein [Sphingosinicella microcystinivorans]RKS91728.1 penicillin-binding protein 1A [Sphingosinicella microcystinivorans]BBE34710.1 penicillin-binding protein 1A [Sphingosinicella microcystinivorans]